MISGSLVTEPASIPSMFFEKKSFFYWLEDGIIELSVESRECGKWKTIDNNISAKGFYFRLAGLKTWAPLLMADNLWI